MLYTTADEKVNAELFLDLSDDDDFLKQLGLSLGFRKLVVKKVNEVSGNSSLVNDGGSRANRSSYIYS